jgi:hypothetical protein
MTLFFDSRQRIKRRRIRRYPLANSRFIYFGMERHFVASKLRGGVDSEVVGVISWILRKLYAKFSVLHLLVWEL